MGVRRRRLPRLFGSYELLYLFFVLDGERRERETKRAWLTGAPIDRSVDCYHKGEELKEGSGAPRNDDETGDHEDQDEFSAGLVGWGLAVGPLCDQACRDGDWTRHETTAAVITVSQPNAHRPPGQSPVSFEGGSGGGERGKWETTLPREGPVMIKPCKMHGL